MKPGRDRTGARGALLQKLGADVTEHRLENGMRVLVASRHLDPVVAAMVYYRVGARNEREHETGVSHFLEHMMFKGSASYAKGEVDLVTTVLGGANNAYTSWDHTAYWFQLASDRWEKALEIEADRMGTLLLDPQEFAAEKEVVLEELSMGEDDPWRHLSQTVQGALFPRHPYRRPVIGYEDTLQAMSPEDMRDYYERFYHPGNATLVLCGDIGEEEALAAAKKHFGSLPAGPPFEEVDAWRSPIGEPKGETRVNLTWDDSGKRLCMAWPTAPVGTEADYAFDLITTILSGGRLARLHRGIVLDQGLAVSASTSNDTRVEGGAFWLFAECASGVEPAELEAAIDEELARLRVERVPAKELARAKAMLRASDAYEHETVSDLAEDLGEYAVDADWRLVAENVERTEKVTADEIREAAKRFLRAERRVIGWCLPREEASDAAETEVPRKRTARTATKKRKTTSGAKKAAKKASTRKVAKKKVTKRATSKKRVAKKQVAKKKSAKKRTAKKAAVRRTTTKKAAKKTTKKQSAKRASAKKTTRKGVTKKRRSVKKTHKKTGKKGRR